ncbi:MAG: glycosyltransferase [Anaerolineae bacterium]|nr:glycosyltransferase [Anaerolineae bacterium]
MTARLVTGQFNDSFVPIIDGVSLTVQNYAFWLNRSLGPAYVVAPSIPGHVDRFEFPVLRYFSVPFPKRRPYRVGIPPFDVAFLNQIRAIPFDLVHAHCPFVAGQLALIIARARGIPIVATFHTKYRENLETVAPSPRIIDYAVKVIVDYYQSVDVVWVPNEATGRTLREYGYTGEYDVVPNGTDIEVQPEERGVLRERGNEFLGTAPTDLVLLFVGQHVWEKNHGLLLAALKIARERGAGFRMFFAGTGYAEPEMRQRVEQLGLKDCVTFLGIVYDREHLKSLYTRADLLLFPSLYDNAPLVVREAAACYLPALLIEGSAAAEGVEDGLNGFLAPNSAEGYAERLLSLVGNRGLLEQAGQRAHSTLYRTWRDVVAEVEQRYVEIVGRYGSKAGATRSRIRLPVLRP